VGRLAQLDTCSQVVLAQSVRLRVEKSEGDAALDGAADRTEPFKQVAVDALCQDWSTQTRVRREAFGIRFACPCISMLGEAAATQQVHLLSMCYSPAIFASPPGTHETLRQIMSKRNAFLATMAEELIAQRAACLHEELLPLHAWVEARRAGTSRRE